MKDPFVRIAVLPPASAPRPLEGRASWRLLFSEAHRTMFFCGVLQAVAAMAWWTLDLGGRHLALYPSVAWTLPPMWAHAWLMLYGLFPLFMFGFLMTAGPNWLGAPKLPPLAFAPAALMLACGLLLFYVGLATSARAAAAGVFLHAAGWLWVLAALVRLLVRHWHPNARYALMIFGFLALGAAGDLLFATAIAAGSYALVRPALEGAVWFFLLPVFTGVSTRMVPFFSSRVLGPSVDYRPRWARPVLIGGALAHGLLALASAPQWLWLIDLPLPAVVACQKGLNEPRYPSLKGIMAAKKKPIDEKPAALGEPGLEVVALTLPPDRPAGRIVGEGAAAVPELVRLLREEAKVI